MRKTLIIGAGGQIGTELTAALRMKWGSELIIASDLKTSKPEALGEGPYVLWIS